MKTDWLRIVPAYRRDARWDYSPRTAYMRAETMRRWLLRNDRLSDSQARSMMVEGDIGTYEGFRFITASRPAPLKDAVMPNQQKHAKHPVDFMQSKGYLI